MACRRTGRSPQTGLAIGAILLAVLLLVAIAIAIAAGMRSGNSSTSQQSDRALASAVIEEGDTLQRGVQQAVLDPAAPSKESCYVTLWTSNSGPYYGLYDPANAASIPTQYPPADAMVDPTQTWEEAWTICWGYIDEPGVGNPTASYADFGMILPDIRQGVCQQINAILNNNSTITVSTENLATWENDPTQAVLHPNNSNQQQACFQTSDGHYIYYTITEPWG